MLPLSLWLQDTDAFSWFLNRIQAQNRENFSLLSKSICVVLDSSEDFEFSFFGGVIVFILISSWCEVTKQNVSSHISIVCTSAHAITDLIYLFSLYALDIQL